MWLVSARPWPASTHSITCGDWSYRKTVAPDLSLIAVSFREIPGAARLVAEQATGHKAPRSSHCPDN